MVKILRIPVSVALLWLSSTSAWADGSAYLGIGMGSTEYRSGNDDTTSNYPDVVSPRGSEPDSSSLKILLGNRLYDLSLDLEIVSLGDINDSTAGNINGVYSALTWSITMGWHKQLTPRFRFFPRLGIHKWKITEFDDLFDTVDSSADITYGLGIDFDFGNPGSYLARFGWDHYEIDSDLVDSSDIVTATLLYQWGS